MDSLKIISGFVAGIAVGATLGILFAPEKGSDLRNRIASKKDGYLDTIKDKINEFTEQLQTATDNATDKL